MSQKSFSRIYLDYAATTPLREESARAMQAVAGSAPLNPSSLHAEGRRARALVDDARERVAALLGASRKEIEFTGGGTEADNHALTGVARALGHRGDIVVTAIEHHAVLNAVDELAREGCAVTVVPVDGNGVVDADAFDAALRSGASIASVMYANNEIGTVAPIARLAARARELGVVFHTDAVAAACWLPLDVGALGVDLLSLSAHKFYGPQGIGVLYVRDGTPIAPLLLGGGQEFGRRAGTENVAAIVGLAAALELAVAERERNAARVGALRDRLEAGILGDIPGTRVNGAGAERLPNISNVTFEGADSAALLARLDLDGVAASAGSACTSGVLEASHVIAALGSLPEGAATLRFSLGSLTTGEEIGRVLELLPGAVERVRADA